MPPFGPWARSAYPVKPPAHLAHLTGRGIRTCNYWMAGKREPGYRDIIAILRSDVGSSFLEHLMRGARPAWWPHFDRERTLDALRRELAGSRERIEQLGIRLE
jgi:hypothetical protein